VLGATLAHEDLSRSEQYLGIDDPPARGADAACQF
jgi:hypothetical protein